VSFPRSFCSRPSWYHGPRQTWIDPSHVLKSSEAFEKRCSRVHLFQCVFWLVSVGFMF